MKRRGFTLLEILIAVALVSTLAIVVLLSTTALRERSYDQRRKLDLDEVKAGLEQYRSVNNAYPTPAGTYGLPFGTAGLTDATRTYVQILPQDPLNPQKSYYYTTSGSDYTLAGQITNPEPTPCQSAPGGDSCGTGNACNYCLGSYGKK